MSRRYLVTGGAGFIGSHIVRALLDEGAEVVVVDNLSQGHRAAVPACVRFEQADVADIVTIDRILNDGPWDAVIHLASLALVGESMQQPFLYFNENVMKAARLIEAVCRHGVKRFVFSSTSALFRVPDEIPITEKSVPDPASPYGESKRMVERILYWADEIHGLRSACLRYFNAAGADPEGRAGEDHDPETHLVPLVIDTAFGRKPELTIFGNDYDTADGTCVRDYVHVSDLARAHVLALRHLDTGSFVANLGTGQGASVREVIRCVEAVTGLRVRSRVIPRRPGDPPVLVASANCFSRLTGWSPRFSRLEQIVETAAAWRWNHPRGYDDGGSAGRSDE